MVVNTLWQVLRPAARTVKLESLKYRRLAIDASIWLTSFIKAMRDSNGDTIHNAHLKGLWGRLCKLLFFGMKPIFVFDGTPPILKAETLLNRRRARMKAQDDLHRIAERILLNQLKLSTISQAKQLLKEGKLQLNDVLQMGLAGVLNAQLPEENSINVEEIEAEKPKEIDLDASVSDLDRSLLKEDETAQFVNQFSAEELRSIDASGDFVAELPKEMQMALLSEMKAAHRGHVGAISLTSPKRISGENYSNLQMEQLIHKGGISRRLESVRGELDQDIFKPIASDPSVRYRLLSTSLTPIKSLLHDSDAVDESTQPDTQPVRVVLGPQFAAVDQNDLPRPSYGLNVRSSSGTLTSSKRIETPSKGEREHLRSAGASSTRLSLASPQAKSSDHDFLSPQEQLIRASMPSLDPDLELINVSSDDENEDNEASDEDLTPVEESGDIEMDADPMQPRTVQTVAQNETSDDEFEDVIFEDVSRSEPIETEITQLRAPSSPTDMANLARDVTETERLKRSTPELRHPIRGSGVNLNNLESNHGDAQPSFSTMTAFGENVDDENEPQEDSSLTPAPSQSTANGAVGLETDRNGGLEHLPDLELVTSARSVSRVTSIPATPSNASSTQSRTGNTSRSFTDSSRTLSVTELDMSTESQHIPSVNQSVVSEEEMQRVSLQSFENLEEELQREVLMLQDEERRGQNQAVTLTSEAVDEAKELLRLFGIPFVQSPSEADAQCAILQNLGLVDGIVSDDSDILVFGGDTVFRYAFSQHHDLELYNMEDIQAELGLDHHSLVFLAFLLGGDYAEGIPKVGPRAALDIVTEFPGPDGMAQFKAWIMAFQQGNEDYDILLTPPSAPFVKRYSKLLSTLKLPESFPHPSVLDAYTNPAVDASKESFSWGWPNLAGLRQFALDKFGWTRERVDTNLLPIIQKYTAALSDKQPKIETFFTQASIHGRKRSTETPKKQRKAKPNSESVPSNANKKKRGRAPNAVETMETIPDTSEAEEEERIAAMYDSVATSLPPSKRYKRSNFDDE